MTEKKCYQDKDKNCWSYMPAGSRVDRYVVDAHIHEKPVYFGHDKKSDRKVVLKRAEPIFEHCLPYDPHRAGTICLDYEARLQKRAKHPNVCPVESIVEKNGRHYLVTPNLGRNLLFHIDKNPPVEERLMILEDIANALVHCHNNNIVHLDVKERNVVVKDKKGILIDFGAAREFGTRHDVADKFALATENCGPPEYLNDGVFTLRSDTFSFAYMAFWTLTGKTPYKQYDTKHEPRYAIQQFHPLSLAQYNGFGELVIAGLNKRQELRPMIKELADAIKEQTARLRRPQNEQTAEPCLVSS